MKVLNLYSGIGGNRKLWLDVEVTAVEIKPKIAKIYQDFFPNDEVIITDAHKFLLENFKKYDFIWSSPPCNTHSQVRKNIGVDQRNLKPKYPDMDLYEEIIFLKHYFKGSYCVENVKGYYKPLIRPQELGRHFFWCNFLIRKAKIKNSIIRYGSNELREALKGFNLDRYRGIDKRLLLRNCVDPIIGFIILESAKGKTQIRLTDKIIKNNE